MKNIVSNKWLWVALGLIAIVGVVLLAYPSKHATPQTHVTPVSQKPTPKPTPGRPLTAGGKPIPKSSAAKAKSLGYYCPSWDAEPGTFASTLCIPLDK